jgi:hypothetical protein
MATQQARKVSVHHTNYAEAWAMYISMGDTLTTVADGWIVSWYV